MGLGFVYAKFIERNGSIVEPFFWTPALNGAANQIPQLPLRAQLQLTGHVLRFQTCAALFLIQAYLFRFIPDVFDVLDGLGCSQRFAASASSVPTIVCCPRILESVTDHRLAHFAQLVLVQRGIVKARL